MLVTAKIIESERVMIKDNPKKKDRKRYVTGVGQKTASGDLVIRPDTLTCIKHPKGKRKEYCDKLC